MYARAWHHAEHKFACTVLRNYTVEDICILAMHSTYDDGTRKKTDANPNIRIIISIYLSILLLTLWGWCLYYEELILLFILVQYAYYAAILYLLFFLLTLFDEVPASMHRSARSGRRGGLGAAGALCQTDGERTESHQSNNNNKIILNNNH